MDQALRPTLPPLRAFVVYTEELGQHTVYAHRWEPGPNLAVFYTFVLEDAGNGTYQAKQELSRGIWNPLDVKEVPMPSAGAQVH